MANMQEMTVVDTQAVFDKDDNWVGMLGTGKKQGRVIPARTNSKRSIMPTFGAALAAMAAGSRNARILLIGDSTQTPQVGGSMVNARQYSVADRLAKLIDESGGVGYSDNCFGSFSLNAATHESLDPRITYGGWAPTDFGSNTWGGKFIASTTPNAIYTGRPKKAYDTLDIYYQTGGGVADISVMVGGQQWGAVLAGAGGGILKATRTGSITTQPFELRKDGTANQGQVIGWSAYKSQAKGVEVLTAAMYGQAIDQFTAAASVFNYCNTAAGSIMGVARPDVVVVDLTINSWINGTVPATYAASLQAVVDAFRVYSDVVLMTGNPTSPATTTVANQRGIVAQMRELAKSNGVPLLDVHAAWGPFDTAVANGLAGGDDRHATIAGYADKAERLQDLLGLV